MAKRKGIARRTKGVGKTRRSAKRKAAKSARKSVRRRRPQARPRKSAPKKKARRTAAAPKRAAVNRPKPAALDRERRRLADEDFVPGAPSTLGYSPKPSPAESGHQMLHNKLREHTEGGPTLTGGDLDSDWSEAYSSGEEAPGGDMPTPDQDVVEEIGRALGVEYEDAEELKGAEKIEQRDRRRWEYDPASSEDYKDRNRKD
jgi:hypothetical protein